MLATVIKRCVVLVGLLVAVPACGESPQWGPPVAYAPMHERGACSFANRTQDACIARCLDNDAASCNDVGRLIELHATKPSDLVAARTYFDRACSLGVPRACRNAGRVAKRREAALGPVQFVSPYGPSAPHSWGTDESSL